MALLETGQSLWGWSSGHVEIKIICYRYVTMRSQGQAKYITEALEEGLPWALCQLKQKKTLSSQDVIDFATEASVPVEEFHL
eukprot:15331285-Ditylum_brightwellii.AAC.1